MKHELHTPDLRNALPPEPDFCHRALMQAAGSVKEDEPVKKNTFRALLIAALLIVTMITVAFGGSESEATQIAALIMASCSIAMSSFILFLTSPRA